MTQAKAVKVLSRNDVFQMLLAVKTNRKKRHLFDEIFIEGIEPIKQALLSPFVTMRKIIYHDEAGLSDWARDLIERNVFPERVTMDPALFRELADKDEPAEILATLRYAGRTIKDIELNRSPFIVIADRPSDHGNLGSLIRSANAFGVDLVVTHGHGVDLFDPKTIRSSLGAVFRTPVAHVESLADLEQWLGRLKGEHGLTVVGTDSAGDTALDLLDLRRPIALIIGNESRGMSVGLKKFADRLVAIPMSGSVNSLNAACAASIVLWQIFKNSR
jgi:23S rRNA (uridine2479-2'-O)-methyltransferase